MSRQELLHGSTGSKLPPEKLRIEANRLIPFLKTTTYNMPEFKASQTEKLCDDKEVSEATIFNKNDSKYTVSYQKGKLGNNLATYENIAIAITTKSAENDSKYTYIRVYTHKNNRTGNIELAHIFYTDPNTSGKKLEHSQSDNQKAVKKIAEFISSLTSPSPAPQI